MNKAYFRIVGSSNSSISLHNQECVLGMKGIPAESVDAVVTSPPYNIGVHYGLYGDSLPRESYLKWIGDVSREIRRILKPEGSLFLNMGGSLKDPWIPMDVAQELRPVFTLQNVIHWVKSITVERNGDSVSVGHYKPIGGKRFLHDSHEYLFHFTRGNVQLDRLSIGVPYQDKTNISRWKGTGHADKRCRGNIWFVPYETITSRAKQRNHPASFPIALPEMCMRLQGLNKRGLVVDPFIGIGSTAVACLRLGVSCIGFDIDKDYLDTASTRLREERRNDQ